MTRGSGVGEGVMVGVGEGAKVGVGVGVAVGNGVGEGGSGVGAPHAAIVNAMRKSKIREALTDHSRNRTFKS